MLDTWFSSALWPFATLGWPSDTPELRAFYPTDVLVTARDIIFLWVARMVMMGMEFMHDVPFTDVDITSIIQAPDGRRMSKSLGTGIDPLDEIEAHGADAVRFGLLAMSSSQDVRYSAEKIQQGQQLANKMWNASRLVLLNVAEVEPAPRPRTVEDRWILSRLQRAIGRWRDQVAEYDLSHAALDLYAFFYGDFCDWYLEMVKPRLYEQEEEVSATLAARARPDARARAPDAAVRDGGDLLVHARRRPRTCAVSPFPQPDDSLLDEEAEREVGDVIEAVRRLRNYRDSVGAPAGGAHPRAARGRSSTRLRWTTIGRLARFEHHDRDGATARSSARSALDGATVEVLPSDTSTRRRPARGSRPSASGSRRDRAGPRQAREQGVHGQGAAAAGPEPSARSSSASRPSWPSSRVGDWPAEVIARARCARPSAISTRSSCSACASGSSACAG